MVEWYEYDGVKTGYVNDEIDAGKAEVICFDQKVNENVVLQAISFLQDVKQVDESITLQLISNYQFYNKWHYKFSKTPVVRFIKNIFLKK